MQNQPKEEGKMKNRLFVLLSGILLAACMNNAMAAAGNMRIGVINLNEIMSQAPQVQAITSKLNQKFEPQQKKMASLQSRLQKEQATYSRNKAVMSDKQLSDLQSKIMLNRRNLMRMNEDLRLDKSFAYQQDMKQFRSKLEAVVTKIAKAKHYDVVLQKETVPYASPSIDMTKDVINALS
jgi:outer membrane protein